VHLLDEKDIQWDHISARKSIHHAIQLGDINKAFKLIEHTFPTIITSSTIREGAHRVLYKLRCQQFIEVLRSEGDAEAIQFAQRHLRQSHPHYADLADSVTCLIAYPHDNAYAIKLLSQDRRIAIADEVNQMILGKKIMTWYKIQTIHLFGRVSTWLITKYNTRKIMETKDYH
jgi:hypothetical protein